VTGERAELERVADADFEDGELRSARLSSGERVCIGRSGGTYFAVCDECPHAGFPMSQGTVQPGGVLECGWHGATFRIADGAVIDGPATDAVRTFPVVVRDGAVFVGVSSGN